MNSVSKNVYIDKFDDKVNKYNNAYHSTIKVSPVYVKSSTQININPSKKINNKDPKFTIGDIVRTSKYKRYTPNCSKEALRLKKSKKLCPDLNKVKNTLN